MRLRFGRISLYVNLPSPCKTFPITTHTLSGTESPLRTHYNPQAVSMNSLEDFLDRFLAVLIFFCNADFKEQSLAGIGHTALAFSYPCASLKAGYSVHSAFTPHKQVSPQSVGTTGVLPSWVSTEIGSGFACRCKPPKVLNSQQQPQFGQKKPSPETSSICPSTIFYPRLRSGGI